MLLFWQNKQFEDMILGCSNSDGHFETFSSRLWQLIGAALLAALLLSQYKQSGLLTLASTTLSWVKTKDQGLLNPHSLSEISITN